MTAFPQQNPKAIFRTGFAILSLSVFLFSCTAKEEKPENGERTQQIVGTWKLLQGIVIEKGDTTVTDYTGNVSFIKIINDTHFAFLQHDVKGGKDTTAVFVAGGGTYSLADSSYTEHLDYCSAREWEGHDFTFTISIKNDTLVQKGIEKVESAGIERVNMEKYIRVKN